MTPLRWLLVLDTCPSGDELVYSYQIALYALDTPAAPPVIISTAEGLLAALLARRDCAARAALPGLEPELEGSMY